MLGLHMANTADWEGIDKRSLNRWQKIAAGSNGVLTPGNVISLLGGIAALYGLFIIADGEIVDGLIFLTLGRIADLADGIIADYTKTKSPLGEIVDAGTDKIVIAAALIILGALELIPWIILIFIAAQNIANVISSVLARLRSKRLHPSRLGKLSAAFSWVTIILYPLGDWLRQDIAPDGGKILMAISIISFGIYIIIGFRASLSYAGAVYKVPAKKLYSLFK